MLMPAWVQIDLRPDGEAIQSYLTLLTGKPTVPYVFVDGEFIGGSEARTLLSGLTRSRPDLTLQKWPFMSALLLQQMEPCADLILWQCPRSA